MLESTVPQSLEVGERAVECAPVNNPEDPDPHLVDPEDCTVIADPKPIGGVLESDEAFHRVSAGGGVALELPQLLRDPKGYFS